MKMKKTLILTTVLALSIGTAFAATTQPNLTKSSEVRAEFTPIQVAQADSPCTKCMIRARDALALCQAKAKTEKQKKTCTTNLQAAVKNCNNGVCKK